LSNNGKGETIVNFDALESEEGDESPTNEQKLKGVLTNLKGKLEAEDYGGLLEALGIKDEMTNAELFAAIKELVKGKEEDKPEDDEEKEAASYKDFMKKCMEGGKSLKECGEEYKKKYPEPAPKEEEIAEVEQLAAKLLKEKKPEDDEEKDEKDAVISDLQIRLKKLEDEKELSGVTAKVDALIKDKHLAPVQRNMAIKLSARLNDEDQGELLEFFRTTQKFSVDQDVGHLPSNRPGATGGGIDLTPERKEELLKLHGLDGLIADKADQSKLPWKERNN